MPRRTFLHAGAATLVAAVASRSWGAQRAAPLRVAQLGTEHSHGPGKWATLKKFPELFTPVGICEPSAALRAKAEALPDYAGVKWLDEAELWSDPQLPAIIVESELPELLKYGRKVLEAGKHLHLDKPPGSNLADFQLLQRIAAEKRRVFQTGYMFRYHPAFRFCFDAVRQGWLGRVFAVHGDIGSEMTAARRPALARTYGGSMMLLGSHLLDAAIAVLGAPEKVWSSRHRSFPERDAYFDNEIAVLEYPHASAVIRSLNAEIGGAKRRQFVVFGENGTIELLPLEPAQVAMTLKTAAGGFPAGAQPVKLPLPTGRYDDMLRDFAGRVRGENSVVPQFDAAHELAVHRVTLQCAGLI